MLRWLRKAASGTERSRRPTHRPRVEVLEDRLVLSSSSLPIAQPLHITPLLSGTSGPIGLLPSQIRHAYGFDQIRFGAVQGDGAGQIIAIIGAYDNPDIQHDLAAFDQAMGLPDPPGYARVDQNGGTNYPDTDPKGVWELESALDVEWAHALAPKAQILLVEAATATFDDLNAAVDYARNTPGVSVVSMSYGGPEFVGENAFDGFFTTPAGHAGVTFVASTGDVGGVSEYPAASPNVLAVGGTTLNLNAAGNYAGEQAWMKGGGGVSAFEGQPAYQKGVVSPTITARSTPDVAFDADPSSGVPVYDSFNNGTASPWVQMGGTSFSAPAWAALIAIANEGRAIASRTSLDGPTDTLQAIYRMPGSDFHDVARGGAPHAAARGYDLVTGRGSPVANAVVSYLVGDGVVATHFRIDVVSGSRTAGAPLTVKVTALDANNQPVSGYLGTVHFGSSDPHANLPADYTFTAADRGSHTFTVVPKTAGSQTLRVTDRASRTGVVTGVVIRPGAALRVRVSAPASATAGVPFRITVDVLDAYGNLIPNYVGTIRLRSSDTRATLPASYTFRPSDRGAHSFVVKLSAPGLWTISAGDSLNRLGRWTVAVRTRPPISPAARPVRHV